MSPRRLTKRLWRLLGMAVVAGGIFSGGARAETTVAVFAAASLKTALDEVAQAFQAETGTKAQISYAGSSALARQIEAGAPADVFISASPDWMNFLVDGGVADPDRVRDLLTNRLALISDLESDVQLRPGPTADLTNALSGGRLAMALVDAVPAGIYGKQALKALGQWEGLQDRVAQTDNVRAALRLVALGEAPLGIVYQTDAQAEPRVRLLGLFPAESHDPIIYPVALLSAAQGGQGQQFFDFLSGEAASGIFEMHGFGLAGGS